MNDLDRETEAQIEKLVEDFRTKITKIVIKNITISNRIL